MFSFIACFTRSKPTSTPLPMLAVDVTTNNRPSVSQRIQAAWQSFVMNFIVFFSCGVSRELDMEQGVHASTTQSSSFYAPEFRSNASTSVPSIPSLPSTYSCQSRLWTEPRGLRAGVYKSTQPHMSFSSCAHHPSRSSSSLQPMRPCDELIMRPHVGDRMIIRAEPTEVIQPPITYKPGKPIETSPVRPNIVPTFNQNILESPPGRPSYSNSIAEPITPPPSPKPISNTPIFHSAPLYSLNIERPISGAVVENVCVSFGVDKPTESDGIASGISHDQIIDIVHRGVQDIRLTSKETHAINAARNISKIHTEAAPRPLPKALQPQQIIQSVIKSVKDSPSTAPSSDPEPCVLLYSGIPTIRIHSPRASISGAIPAKFSVILEDDGSASPTTSLFNSTLNSAASAVDSTEVPDATDSCSASVSSASIYSQGDLLPTTATERPEIPGRQTALGLYSQTQDDQKSMVSKSDLVQRYFGESNECELSRDEEVSGACSIIFDKGVVQKEHRTSIEALIEETVPLATEFRKKSQLIQSTYPIQESSQQSISVELDGESMPLGDSSLTAENSASTVSVESDQFKYDQNDAEDNQPKGALTSSIAKSSSHLALLAALGLLTNQDPENSVVISRSQMEPQASTKKTDSHLNYNDSFNLDCAGATAITVCSAPSSVLKGVGHRKSVAPLHISVPKATHKLHTEKLLSTSSFSSVPHSAPGSSSDSNPLLPTPPRTPVESLHLPRPLNHPEDPQYTTSTSRFPTGIPARKAFTPILPNPATKRETNSTTSSRLKNHTRRTAILNPNAMPPITLRPLVPSNQSFRPAHSTKPDAPIRILAPRPQFAPSFKPPTQPMADQPPPASIPSRLLQALEPSTNTRRVTPIGILPSMKTASNSIPPKGKIVQPRIPSAPSASATHRNPLYALKPKQMNELIHAGHDSTRLWQAVEMGHWMVIPADISDNSSRTSSGAHAPISRLARPAPTLATSHSGTTPSNRSNLISPSSIDETNRRRGLRSEDTTAFVVVSEKSTHNHSLMLHSEHITPMSDPKILTFRSPNRQNVQSTNVWI